jgi:sRNA-binding carbon storage regulator CsrA
MAMSLRLTLKLGDGFTIGDAHIEVAEFSHAHVALYIDAPKTVQVLRDGAKTREAKS